MDIRIEKLIGEGATAKIYRNGNFVTKVYRNASAVNVNQEMRHQQFAYHSGLPVPNVYTVRRLDDGGIALDMQYIDGLPLMNDDMSVAELAATINILVELQYKIHQVQAPALPKLVDTITDKILSTSLEKELKNELLTLLSQLDDQSEHLCHGDFHPFNILDDGVQHWIIDWVDAAAGNPLADSCRTYLIMKPQAEALAELYLQILCAEAGYQPSDILKWQPVIAAARLNENIDDLSRAYLHDLVQVWYEGLG